MASDKWYGKDLEECPEYWLDPADKCRNAVARGAFYYCKALTNTDFGIRHCPFCKTAAQYYAEQEVSREVTATNKLIHKPGRLVIKVKGSLYKRKGGK